MTAADWTTAPCCAPSEPHAEDARARQAVLTKPAGSLGRLETLAVELAALQRTDRPSAARAPILIFAGDHGVTARGVSAYPSEVTVEMLRNFARGGAAIAVLARELGLDYACLALVELPLGRFARPEVLALVTHPNLLANMPEASIDDVRQLVSELGVFYGLDR